MFEAVRKGEIRVLLGSTFKLGMGVNVQDKLIAIHHIDVPWKPADMTQRNGRIIRQGNTNEEVFIYRYITEGSFDAYSWQLLESKQRFISAILQGSIKERYGSDISDTVLNYAEVKALAIGNPLIKKRVETAIHDFNSHSCNVLIS
jgi:SNF2 family DNA or RNA helicase